MRGVLDYIRRAGPWLGLAILVVLVAAAVGYIVLAGQARSEAFNLVSTAAVVVVPVGAAGGWLLSRIRNRNPAHALSLERVADDLAGKVKDQWELEAQRRKLIQPAAIPVRWRWSTQPITGPVADATSDSARPVRLGTLPGISPATSASLDHGTLNDLLDVYGGVDSGRIVIVGTPGAGKTGAAILLLLSALIHRSGMSDADRARTPVPVVLVPDRWDPADEPVDKWLASQLILNYPSLRASEYGPDVAIKLIRRGLVSPFLDGLDDLSEPVRVIAIQALNEQATFRLVVLSRTHEMLEAVAAGHLAGAAGVELLPIDPQDAAEYLNRCQVAPLPAQWAELTDAIKNSLASPVSRALASPLMLTLVRDTYAGSQDTRPNELCDVAAFPTPEAVEDHLLNRVLPAAYAPRPGQRRSRYGLAQAQVWLGHIAERMEGTSDLAWWRLPNWEPARPRMIATGLVVFALGLAVWLALARGNLLVIVGTVVASLACGYTLGGGGNPPEQVGQFRLGAVLDPAALTAELAVGLGIGLWGGIITGVTFGAGSGFVSGGALGLAGVIAMAIGIGISTPSAERNSPLSPLSTWHSDRLFGLVFGLVIGLTSGVAFSVGPLRSGASLATLVFVVGLAVVIGLTIGVIYPGTWPATLSFVQMWKHHVGPLRMMRFLEDAREREVLRVVGPFYQFRHARLQDRLVEQSRAASVNRAKTEKPDRPK